MPNDISQATTEGQVIPQGVEVQGEAAPQEASTQQEPQTESKPLTREEVQELIRSEATKIAQSQVAKGENRIQKVIQEKLTALNTSKEILGLTEEQFDKAKDKIVRDAYSAPEPQEETPTSESSPAPDVERAIQYMNAQIDGVFAEVGTTVTKTDPEFKELQSVIDASWNDARGLTKITLAAERLANAKAKRLQALNENAEGRVIGSGGDTSGTGRALSPDEKISQGLRTTNWNNPSPKA